MNTLTKINSIVVAIVAIAVASASPSASAPIRIGDAGTMGIEKLIEAVALENAKKRGVDYIRLSLKSDDITKQAFLIFRQNIDDLALGFIAPL